MAASTVYIKEIDFEKIHVDATVAIIGKRRTGKTTWGKIIVSSLHGRIGRFCLISGNRDVRFEWQDCISSLFVTPVEYGIGKLSQIKEYQGKKISEYRRRKIPIPFKYRLCLIMDDCGTNREFMHSAIVRDICANGRHYGLFTLFISQYYYQIPKNCRENIDYVCMLATSNVDNIEKIRREKVGIVGTRIFKYVVSALTCDYGMCFIDTTNPRIHNVSDSVFYKPKCKKGKHFILENRQVYKYGKMHNKEEFTQESQEEREGGVTPSNEFEILTKFKFEYEDKRGRVLVVKDPITTDQS